MLAADKHLSALAQAMKKAGAEGTKDLLRARAYLHLLAGQPAETLLATGQGIPAVGTPGNGTAGAGPAGAESAGTESAGTGPAGTGPAGRTGLAGVGAPELGLPALRGAMNLTMPLATWLGWSQSPGQVPGFGTLDADDSRTLAAMLAGDPANRWCITLTDPTGRPIAHGCAKTGPHPPGPGSGTAPGTGPRAGPGPAGGPGWITAVKITPLQTGDCSHPRETPAYQPGPTLRHIIEIRQSPAATPAADGPPPPATSTTPFRTTSAAGPANAASPPYAADTTKPSRPAVGHLRKPGLAT